MLRFLLFLSLLVRCKRKFYEPVGVRRSCRGARWTSPSTCPRRPSSAASTYPRVAASPPPGPARSPTRHPLRLIKVYLSYFLYFDTWSAKRRGKKDRKKTEKKTEDRKKKEEGRPLPCSEKVTVQEIIINFSLHTGTKIPIKMARQYRCRDLEWINVLQQFYMI